MTNKLKTFGKAALFFTVCASAWTGVALQQTKETVTNCRIEFGGSVFVGETHDAFACAEKSDALVYQNPRLQITKVSYEHRQLAPGLGVLQLCKVGFGGAAQMKAYRSNGLNCLKFANRIQDKNPTLRIQYITHGESLLHGELPSLENFDASSMIAFNTNGNASGNGQH